MARIQNSTLFKARYYEPGSGDSVPIEVEFEGAGFRVLNNGRILSENDLSDWSVNLSGSAKDRVTFYNATTRDTVIVNDLKVLDCLAKDARLPGLIKQAKAAKRQRFLNGVGANAGRGCLVFVVLFFITFVLIGFTYGVTHPRKTSNTADQDSAKSTEQTESETQTYKPTGNSEQDRYMEHLESKIRSSWEPAPSASDYDIKLSFIVHADGHATKIRVLDENNTGAKAALAAIAAVRRAQPFGKLPKSMLPHTEIEFTLDYVAHEHDQAESE